MDRKCLLSVAMIVKDEEKNIKRALESVKGVVDDIVVVDTGSKDKTPEIARQYTSRVYFYEWKNDFSEARNYSLKFPYCEWVLILDADEELSEDFRKNIRDFLLSLPEDVNTIYVPTVNFLDWNFASKEIAATPRIFRNGTVYYKNPVHNQAVYKPKVERFPCSILHYGYIWTRKLKRKKYERTKTLIEEHLKNIKDKDSPEYIYYLVQLYKTEKIGGKIHETRRLGWKIYEEIVRIKKIPSIALEFLFLFGIDLVDVGLFDIAKKIFEIALSVRNDFPDPYLGLMLVRYNKKDYKETLNTGKKFFKVYNDALSKIEFFDWTVMSIKYVQLVHLIMSHVYLYFGNVKNSIKHLHFAIESENMESPGLRTVLKNIIEFLVKEADKNLLEQSKEYIKNLIDFSKNKGVNINWDNLVEKLADLGITINFDIPVKSPISNMILEKMKNPSKDFLLNVLMGDSENEVKFLKKTGIPGVLFIYSQLLKKEQNLSVLKKLREWAHNVENPDIKGVINALMADEFLKLGNFSETLKYYRKSLELLPELSRFIKPVIEDLKTSLVKDIEGVFDELMTFFLKNKELILDAGRYIEKEILKKLYLVSNSDFAKYISAINIDDPKKAIELLESIKEPDKFPYYYHRLAEKYKEIDLEKAFQLYNKSVIENPSLADISGKQFSYTGLYFTIDFPYKNDNDKIIWVGNLSEKFITFGVINPIRAWRLSSNGLIYAYPFPSDYAIKIYEEREKKYLKKKPIKIEVQSIGEVLSVVHWKDLKIIPDDEKAYRTLLEDLGMRINPNSRNVLITYGVEQIISLNNLIPKYTSEALIFFFIPDLYDKNDELWFYPGFRIFRTIKVIRNELENLGYSIKKVMILGKNLRALWIEKERV